MESLLLQDTILKDPMEKSQKDSPIESNPEKNAQLENDPQQKPSIIDDKSEKNIPTDNLTREDKQVENDPQEN